MLHLQQRCDGFRQSAVTLERDGLTLVICGVPAQVCENGGEEYVEEAVAERLLDAAETDVRSGVRFDVQECVGV